MQRDVNTEHFYSVIYLEISNFSVVHREITGVAQIYLRRTEGRFTKIINNKDQTGKKFRKKQPGTQESTYRQTHYSCSNRC